jgi:hypothetical protein
MKMMKAYWSTLKTLSGKCSHVVTGIVAISLQPHCDAIMQNAISWSCYSSNQYKEPIAAAAAQEEQLSEQRTERLNRVKFVEKEKEALEGSKQEAELFLTTQNQVIGIILTFDAIRFIVSPKIEIIARTNAMQLSKERSKLYQIWLHDAKTRVEAVSATHAVVKEQHSTVKNELHQLLKQATDMERVRLIVFCVHLPRANALETR